MLRLYTSVGRRACVMQYVCMVVWCVCVCVCVRVCVCERERECVCNVCVMCVYVCVLSRRTESSTAASFGIFCGSFGRKRWPGVCLPANTSRRRLRTPLDCEHLWTANPSGLRRPLEDAWPSLSGRLPMMLLPWHCYCFQVTLCRKQQPPPTQTSTQTSTHHIEYCKLL